MARSYKLPSGYNRKGGRVKAKGKLVSYKTKFPSPSSAANRQAAKSSGMTTNGGVSTSLKASSFRTPSGYNRRASRA